MKIRTRLCIAFIIILLLPILVTGLVIYFFGMNQTKSIANHYGVEADSYQGFPVPIPVQVYFNMTNVKFHLLQDYAENNTEFFEDMEQVEQINRELMEKESYLILYKEDIPYYVGVKSSDKAGASLAQKRKLLEEGTDVDHILQLLKDLKHPDDSGMGHYFGENMQVLLRQVEFQFGDGTQGRAYIITSLRSVVPEVRALLIKILLVALLVMFITSTILVHWVVQGFMKPINMLSYAAQNIKEGNLDFTIEVHGNDEISELCQDFEEMRKRLRDSVEEQMEHDRENKELISNISHDLKTPMTAVLGYVQGIRDGVADTPEKMERYMKTIYTKAMDMDRLINELTFYSKIDTNRIPYVFDELMISDFFEDCVEESSWDLESKDIRLEYHDFLEENTMVIADSEQLHRAVNNILGNSVKYMNKSPGHIGITLKEAGDFIEIEIADNGMGISPKDLPNIFDRFYRTDLSRNSSKGGSGIGLSIVKKIIEDHGGRVWATSKEGVGTVVFISLRRYRRETI